jgi:hypothetical protein
MKKSNTEGGTAVPLSDDGGAVFLKGKVGCDSAFRPDVIEDDGGDEESYKDSNRDRALYRDRCRPWKTLMKKAERDLQPSVTGAWALVSLDTRSSQDSEIFTKPS